MVSEPCTVEAVTVLVVEDDDDIRATMVDALIEHGFSVHAVPNGREAIDYLFKLDRGHLPKVILLDIMMPIMDGVEFRREQLKNETFATIPVIVTSTNPELFRRAAGVGSVEYVPKPFDIAKLKDTIKRCAGFSGPVSRPTFNEPATGTRRKVPPEG